MPTYSHSRIGTFETCRLQFKYRYIDKVKTEQEDTAETFLGSLVHEALERLYKNLQHERRMTADELSAWFTQEWTKRWDPETIKIVHREYSSENYRDMGVRFLNDYYGRYAPFVGQGLGRTLGLETEELLDLGDDIKYHVRIDRLADAGDGVYEIHDYKTGALKTQDELAQDRQLAMYAYWVYRAFPDAQRVKLVWHFLAYDKEFAVERPRSELERLKEDVRAKIGEIAACAEFPPTKSALCDWCAYQGMCPLWKHKLATDALEPEAFRREDGVKLVDEYAALKEEEARIGARLADVQADLYRYADEHGVAAIFGSAQKATVWSKETVKLPGKNEPAFDDLRAALQEEGKYLAFSTVDTWKLADALQAGSVRLAGFAPRRERIRRIYLSRR